MNRAILFDFDGVLAATFSCHFRAWQRVLAPFGLQPDEFVVKINEGQSARLMAGAIFKTLGKTITQEEAIVFANQKNEYFRQQKKPVIFAEITHILDLAKTNNLKTAIVTGTTLANLQHVLGEPVLRLFNAVVQDGDYNLPKPNPEPYIVASKRLKVKPTDCLVVENAPLGIQAAKTAGMFCIALMTTLSKKYLSGADLILKNHGELLLCLPKLLFTASGDRNAYSAG